VASDAIPGDAVSSEAVPTGDVAPAGPQLARAALEAAQARRAARQRGGRSARGALTRSGDGAPTDEGEPADGPGSGASGSGASGSAATGGWRGPRRVRGYSGAGPDPRDPQLFGAILGRLVKTRGWQRPAAEARVFGSWDVVVGADIAAHCRPVRLEGGELTVEAESTAWATQLRLLSGKLIAQIARQVGHNVVMRLNIHGPTSPSWSRGLRRVRGRGPRDTYG
jgi:predicted nucleic acid-binding Zn ribbon protein